MKELDTSVPPLSLSVYLSVCLSVWVCGWVRMLVRVHAMTRVCMFVCLTHFVTLSLSQPILWLSLSLTASTVLYLAEQVTGCLQLIRLHVSWSLESWISCKKCGNLQNHLCYRLTLCCAQCLKTSARGHGQNVPKHLVAIGKLRWFHTRIFPYNLARISWVITVWDFRCFLPRHLHCLCVRSESERVFESRVEEMRCRFSRWVSSIQTNNSMAFMLKVLCFEKL